MAQQLKLLNLKSLPELGDGDLERDFEAALALLVKDCLARPSIKKKRQVSIVIDIEPQTKQDGTCDDVNVDVQVASKSPAKIVPTHTMRTTANGGLRYNPASPGNPDQKTLDFDE